MGFVEQARDWVALRHAFTGATVTVRATIAHPDGQLAVQEWGHSNIATLQLPDPADYTTVSAAMSTLGVRFTRLHGLDWTVSASKSHPADITTSRRFPSEPEIGVWNQLNADQSIAHTDTMRVNAPMTPPLWIAEATTGSHDVDLARQLARHHLPIAATLAPPVLYTASDEESGHLGAYGQAIGPGAITIGGCTPRDLHIYQPTVPERALSTRYETCRN